MIMLSGIVRNRNVMIFVSWCDGNYMLKYVIMVGKKFVLVMLSRKCNV